MRPRCRCESIAIKPKRGRALPMERWRVVCCRSTRILPYICIFLDHGLTNSLHYGLYFPPPPAAQSRQQGIGEDDVDGGNDKHKRRARRSNNKMVSMMMARVQSAGGLVILVVFVLCGATCAVSGSQLGWSFAGPSTYVQRGDATKMSSAGAIQDAVFSGNTWFVGSVNGGVWRTTNLTSSGPQWTNVLDSQPVTCSSISAMHVSQSNPKRIYAGCGGPTSSEQGEDWNVLNSGDWAGIMMSVDGGSTWSMIDAFPVNYYVTSILETENDNLLVSAQSNLYDANDGGVWLSLDNGASFSRILSQPTFNLMAIVGRHTIIATHSRLAAAASVSQDNGRTWADFSSGLDWATGMLPFYTCVTLMADGHTLVLGALTVLESNTSSTGSALFVRSLAGAGWQSIPQVLPVPRASL